MDCEHANELFVEHLMGTLEDAPGAELRVHLSGCAECRREADRLSATWRMLGLLPTEKPSPMLRARFYQTLEAYTGGVEEGRAARQPGASAAQRAGSWWTRWLWPGQPLFQAGAALACVVLGVAVGHFAFAPKPEAGETARLREEVRNMHEMVALALLQNQQSASDRLRGVSYSYRVGRPDTEVIAALLQTVNHDPSVNVRLAAVDALRSFAQSPAARDGLGQSLEKQDSPMVQVALIDALVDLRDAQAMHLFQDLASKTDANRAVRDRAQWGMRQLETQ